MLLLSRTVTDLIRASIESERASSGDSGSGEVGRA